MTAPLDLATSRLNMLLKQVNTRSRDRLMNQVLKVNIKINNIWRLLLFIFFFIDYRSFKVLFYRQRMWRAWRVDKEDIRHSNQFKKRKPRQRYFSYAEFKRSNRKNETFITIMTRHCSFRVFPPLFYIIKAACVMIIFIPFPIDSFNPAIWIHHLRHKEPSLSFN